MLKVESCPAVPVGLLFEDSGLDNGAVERGALGMAPMAVCACWPPPVGVGAPHVCVRLGWCLQPASKPG